MIDQVHLIVQAGDGGSGSSSFMPRKDRKIVPCGGDGGTGGRVIVQVSEHAPPLESLKFKQHLIAQAGAHGGNNDKRGRNGNDLILQVPEGTRLYDRGRSLVIREHMKKNETIVLLEGGRGGKGNSYERESTPGQKGCEIDLQISTRVLADVFLVGLPNSGKSLLLSTLTRAQVASEAYPFSTLDPRLGMFKTSDYESLRLCELPSIFKDSSEGRGLGNHFLKHLELAKLLVIVVDVASQYASSPTEGVRILRKELEACSEVPPRLKTIVIVNKMDLPEAKAAVADQKIGGRDPVFFVSALTGEGLDKLKVFLRDFYHQIPPEEDANAAQP